ncbi:MAG TPA: class I SAM-dependent methyltransferase [Abditibacteriaceae bacterium]|jgi:SAM-dependent methyltransferase
MENSQEQSYPGNFYAPIGDFLREEYLQYGFTQGTRQEVEFLLDLLQLPGDARILDVGCGAGRHSLELARRGFVTVGIDISAGLIEVAQRAAQEEDLQAEFYVGDARELEFSPEFDAAICLCQGAFGLAGDEAGHRRVLAGIHDALKPGALLVLTALNALHLLRSPDLAEQDFDPQSLTMRYRETIRNAAGETREVDIYNTTFTPRELKWLLQDTGFAVEAIYGCIAGDFARKPLTLDDFEIMTVARRI